MLPTIAPLFIFVDTSTFQWAPTLGGECYQLAFELFPWHKDLLFQWAPTLGGECYVLAAKYGWAAIRLEFQWAPTLGGECYRQGKGLPSERYAIHSVSMGTHPWG